MKIAKLKSKYSYKIIAFDKNNKKFIVLEKSLNSGWVIGCWRIKEKFLNDWGFYEILEKEKENGFYNLEYLKRFKKISLETIDRLFEDGFLLPWVSEFCKNKERKNKAFYYKGAIHFQL